MISVICCYNNLEQFNSMKLSLKNNIDADYELIEVNNVNNDFKSAASALNYGASVSQGDILLFVHQDILFNDQNCLKNIAEILPNDSILGLFGAAYPKCKYEASDLKFSNLHQVDTVDECFFAMKREVWDHLKFNEDICNGWHLYAVEMCLRAQDNNIKVGSCALGVKHLSIGNVDDKYMKTLRVLINLHKDKRWIATTCKTLPTSNFAWICYYLLWKTKRVLFNNYPLSYKIKSLFSKR